MTHTNSIDRLVIAIVSDDQVSELTQQLVKGHFFFTRIESSGGFLQRASISLLIGIAQARYEDLMALLRQYCKRRRTYVAARLETPMQPSQPVMIEAEVGGAVVYSFEVERFVQV
jgi:uncharacterized protein YaaQ